MCFLESKKDGVLAWVIFILTAMFLMYEMGLQMAPSVMTADVMRDLQLDAKTLGSAMGVYFFSYSIMQIPAGMLYDRFSARTINTAVTALCALSAWCYGHANSAFMLGLSRFLMGAASSFAFVAVLTAAYRWFSQQYYALFVGLTQLLAALGAVFGTAPLASYLSSVHWRIAFNQLACFGGILAVLIFLVVRKSPQGEDIHHDGQALTVLDSAQTVMGNWQSWWLFLYAFLMWGSVTIFCALWGTDYLSALYNISTVEAAKFSWYFWLTMAIASPFLGYLSDSMGQRGPILRWSAALGVLVTALMISPIEVSMGTMRVLMSLFGLAVTGHIISFAVVKDINKPSVVSTASGMNNMGVVVGGAVLQPLVGLILDYVGPDKVISGIPHYGIASYQSALTVMPICFLLAFIIARWGIKETYCQSTFTH